MLQSLWEVSLTFAPLFTAIYIGVNWYGVERTKMLKFRNDSMGDSNPGSVDGESSILPHCTDQSTAWQIIKNWDCKMSQHTIQKGIFTQSRNNSFSSRFKTLETGQSEVTFQNTGNSSILSWGEQVKSPSFPPHPTSSLALSWLHMSCVLSSWPSSWFFGHTEPLIPSSNFSITTVNTNIENLYTQRNFSLCKINMPCLSNNYTSSINCVLFSHKYCSNKFESPFATVSKIGHFRSPHRRPSWLRCINEYLAIDSGGNVSDLVVARNCCPWLECFPEKPSWCRNEQVCQGGQKVYSALSGPSTI